MGAGSEGVNGDEEAQGWAETETKTNRAAIEQDKEGKVMEQGLVFSSFL